jgi:hypothetical protein
MALTQFRPSGDVTLTTPHCSAPTLDSDRTAPANDRGAATDREEVTTPKEKPMQIVIQNLPNDVTETEIREA